MNAGSPTPQRRQDTGEGAGRDGSGAGPGSRRGGRARLQPRGRQIDPEALAEIGVLLGDRPRRRDLLIEHLHLIQDRYHCLRARHLAALAEEMGLPLAEIYEVASFYAHFDIIEDGEETPPPVTVRICESLPCRMAGAAALRAEIEAGLPASARVVGAPCLGQCDGAPAAQIGLSPMPAARPEAVRRAVIDRVTAPQIPDYIDYESYVAQDGYCLLRACLSGQWTVQALLDRFEQGELRGLGGAGFPAWRKWGFVLAEDRPRYMVLNADESEVATFKDRWCLTTDPHRVLEGMLIASWAIEAEAAYIYLRDEYPHIHRILAAEIPKVEAAGLAPPGGIVLRRGAGAYICGEESAMIESIEGKRGYPRHRPPFVAQRGLFDRPTLVNNVETMFWIRDLIERGPDWFAGQGRHGHAGLHAFSVCGRVREPGVKLAPAGITMAELIDEHCGGMAPGHSLKAFCLGGSSGGILPADYADRPLHFGALDDLEVFLGSSALIVLSDQDNVAEAARSLMDFLRHESCGQCTPCRVGTEKAHRLMGERRWDEGLLRELSGVMADASICGLGQAAPNPILSVLRWFRDDVPAIREG